MSRPPRPALVFAWLWLVTLAALVLALKVIGEST